MKASQTVNFGMVMSQIMTQCNGFLVTLYSPHIGTLLKHIYCDKGVLLKANAAYYTQAFFHIALIRQKESSQKPLYLM